MTSKTLLAIPVAILLGIPLVLLLLSSGTDLKSDRDIKVIGVETPVKVHAANPHGVRRVTATIEQNGARYKVYESPAQPSTRVFFFGKHEQPRDFDFTVGQGKAPQLKDGKARVIIESVANDFRSKTDALTYDVDVNTQPLTVSADGFQHYINQGGSELVVFKVGGYWTEAGVRVGKYTFRSFPFPGKEKDKMGREERFSLFAYPWDLGPNEEPIVYARNPTGSEARASFWFKLFPKEFRTRDIEIDDKFMQKVVTELDPSGSGDLAQRFVKINKDMRIVNNQTLADLRNKTEERFLWHGPFVQLGNSKVESRFADNRNYVYHGKKIDNQTHLGFDLSVTAHIRVVASNDGKVVWAAPLGIYGNCIVIDHGYGLQSIYGHLSEIGQKVGDSVKRGEEIGRSGATGLAGGDHLHFSMQVDGVQVNPVEWWDAHWIHDRILSKVPESAAAAK